MAVQVAMQGSGAGVVEAPDYAVAWRPDDEQSLPAGRLVIAAAVAFSACLLVAAPAIVGLASIVDGHALASAPAWMQGIPGALSAAAAWRVPAAIVLVLGLAVARRSR